MIDSVFFFNLPRYMLQSISSMGLKVTVVIFYNISNSYIYK